MTRRLLTMLSLLVLVAFVFPAAAQEATPFVTVVDQLVDDTVHIDAVQSPGPGWVVIHVDNNGSPGPVAGFAPVRAGYNVNVFVDADTAMLTPVLYAMLHADTGQVGVYEFGQVEGADTPVSANGQVVTPAFNVVTIDTVPQFVVDNTVTVPAVTSPVNGWLVIHADNNGAPGPVLGQTQVSAGAAANVVVQLNGDITNTLWPMLHEDTGQAGVYEFGQVEGADLPVRVGGRVAVTPFSTVPTILAQPQIIVNGENVPADAEIAQAGQVFRADAVLSQGPGWLVIHADNNGSPGPVLGQTALADGLNPDVDVALEGQVTPVVWPMLHTDSGEVGVYEFGQVEGADGPVQVDGQAVTFPVDVAPSIEPGESELTMREGAVVLTVEQVVIDAPGWLVIHANNNGAPGAVIGHTFIDDVLNPDVVVTVDETQVGDQVFPMLHYDTATAGVYEFGQVEGADPPVRVNGQVVVAPMSVTRGEALPPAQAPAPEATAQPDVVPPATEEAAAPAVTTGDCRVSATGSLTVNIRSDASTNAAPRGVLTQNDSLLVDGVATVGDFLWYHVAEGVVGGGWVRADVVATTGNCENLPEIPTTAGTLDASMTTPETTGEPSAAPTATPTSEPEQPQETPES